jgi:ion channel POLLUX/CASTOR
MTCKYYLGEDEELNFFEVILRARQRKEIVIGYRLEGTERAIINPDKVSRRRWSPKDVFVVIAEKERKKWAARLPLAYECM